MMNRVKYFSIKSFEWLPPTNDGRKIQFIYMIADDDQGIQNPNDSSIVIILSRSAEMEMIKKNASLGNEINLLKVINEFLRKVIKNSIIVDIKLPSEKLITSYDNKILTNPDLFELRLGEWEEVNINRKMGFLSS